jgi:pimeloyl-ACP methyl ester carboxylesterase
MDSMRRIFLKLRDLINPRLSWFTRLCNVALVFCIVACGGGGGAPVTPDNPILRTLSKTIDPAIGGTLVDPASGLTLIYPPNTDVTTGPQNIQINIHQKQPGGAVPPGFGTTPFGIELLVRPDMISASAPPTVTIPSNLQFDPLRTATFFRDAGGEMLPLSVQQNGMSNQIVVTLTSAAFSPHGNSSRPLLSTGIAGWIISVWGLAPSFVPATGRFFVYNSGNDSWAAPPSQMPAKRVAVVIHGIRNDVTDMIDFLGMDLNKYVATPTYNGPVYDQIWGYQYTWYAHINDSGQKFANDLRSVIGPNTEVDIYAHSMGGLVSRWALEKEGMGASIHRLVTLDTPHEGVPLGGVQFLVNFVANQEGFPIQGEIPGIEDLVEPIWDPFHNTFLDHLNSGSSPYKGTAQYYSTAGTNWPSYRYVGPIMEFVYNPFKHTTDHDGIVQVKSANSSVLLTKSDSYALLDTHTLVFSLNHSQVNGEPNNSDGSTSSPQLIVENGLKDFIIGTLNGSVH